MGEPETAIARLCPLTISSDDPDYAAQFARILNEVGRVAEAREWRDRRRLATTNCSRGISEAFADHAAEFWLEAGADPDRALVLAHEESRSPPDKPGP